jgi:uncharacterized protein YbbC (DUF1343 family)
MTCTLGIDRFFSSLPAAIRGRRIGVLCHAASIDSHWRHLIDLTAAHAGLHLGAVFGPQHGLYGVTQANMIEWEGGMLHPRYQVPLYSLYGRTRTPTKEMLAGLEGLLIDLFDVGARPYTYIWTMKNCLQACEAAGVPVWVLDRPNPISALDWDGPLCLPSHFSFVGGAQIPLCHRLTIGEVALALQHAFFPSLQLHLVQMQGWYRDSLYSAYGLPWVLPSPNMPTLDTALVYPGMVLCEATNVSEGRGTTRPFELVGAPFVSCDELLAHPAVAHLQGCVLREHHFTPVFDKFRNTYCHGIQIHVTEPRAFHPVYTAAAILTALWDSAGPHMALASPPYEYEYEKMPMDILAGGGQLRGHIVSGRLPRDIRDQWHAAYGPFMQLFKDIACYPERP